jgi:pimeloyl-ACP methyl ester carboxylesterase
VVDEPAVTDSGDERTYVLVHGGGTTGRYWDRVVPLLDGPVVVATLPGREPRPAELQSVSVRDEEAAIVEDVRAAGIEGPIVLVAHSSGGLPVPGVVAALDGQVAHVVLNAALVPREGGNGLDGMQPKHAAGLRSALEGTPEDRTEIVFPAVEDPERLRKGYGGELLDDEQLAFAFDPERNVPDGVHHYRQEVRWTQAGDVPVTYVVNDPDRPIPVDLQEEMLQRLPNPPTVHRLQGGHVPAITAPEAFAALVLAAGRGGAVAG